MEHFVDYVSLISAIVCSAAEHNVSYEAVNITMSQEQSYS